MDPTSKTTRRDLLQEQSEALYALKVWNAIVDGLFEDPFRRQTPLGRKVLPILGAVEDQKSLLGLKTMEKRTDGILMCRTWNLEPSKQASSVKGKKSEVQDFTGSPASYASF